MTNKYIENINNAYSDHDKAWEIYHDHIEARRVQLNAVEKLYEKPLDILNKEVSKKLKAKHEVVAEAISNTPQWYKDKELFTIVMDCMYEEYSKNFFHHNEFYPVSHAVDDSFKDIFADLTWPHSLFFWYSEKGRVEESEVKFATPTIHLDASESDDKLEKLAHNLDDYLHVAHSLLEGKKGVYDIYIPVDRNEETCEDDFCGIEDDFCGIYSPAPGKYKVKTEVITSHYTFNGNTDGCISLLEALKEVQRDHWFSDNEDIHSSHDQ